MSTFDKLSKLEQTKQEIKNAIEYNGVNVGNAKFAEYPSRIEETGKGVDIQDGVLTQKIDGVVTAYVYSSNGIAERLINKAYTITDIVLIDDITEISSGAFSQMESLENFDFREPLKTIGYSSLSSTPELKMPDELPITVEVIDHFAFSYSTFKKLHAKGVKKLGSYSLRENHNLESVRLGSQGNPVESISTSAMSLVSSPVDITLYVDNPSEGLPGAPWGATNATIHYEQA